MQMPNTRRIRQILATVIIVISVALAGTIMVRQFRTAPSDSVSRPVSPEIDMSIAKLDFSEMRGSEKLWNLTAERADYDKDTGAAQLVKVKAEIFGSKTGGMVITAETGSYDETRRLVLMQKQVHAVTRKGMVFDTEQLEYRTGPGLILTDRPVKVVDGRLTLTARSMEMTLSDEQVRFTGTVNAVIEGYHANR
jgi:LPS export ABC transporter protein LptC